MIPAWRADGARVLRLCVFSVIATVLALGSHVLAGGAPPELPVTAVTVLLTLLTAAGLSRRARGPIGLGVPLAALQLVLHEILTSAAGPVAGQPAGHVHDTGSAGIAMALAHAAAVLVTALLLARGERLLGLVLGWLRPVPAPGAVQEPPPVFRTPGRPVVAAAVALRSAVLLAAAPAVRRGPPARTC
jgi:hypothetical protein